MWSARGAYRNAEGRIVPLPERSPLWTNREALLKQIERDHRGLTPVQRGTSNIRVDRYRWMDEEGVERFVVIDERK